MTYTRRTILASVAASAAVAALPARAETVVTVVLWDKGLDVEMGTGLGHAMGGDMSMATMGITATPAIAPAGIITFDVQNKSKYLVHEMVIAPLSATGEILAYLPDEDKVDEDAAIHLGEVAELEPGGSGRLSISIKPGSYILYCNIPGHYMAGMWTVVEAT